MTQHISIYRFILATLAGLLPAVVMAADLEAGKAKAQSVCAACHGANGVSVSDTIPNLAGQRAKYLEAQLRAWKDGSRKNALMKDLAAVRKGQELLSKFKSGIDGAPGEELDAKL